MFNQHRKKFYLQEFHFGGFLFNVFLNQISAKFGCSWTSCSKILKKNKRKRKIVGGSYWPCDSPYLEATLSLTSLPTLPKYWRSGGIWIHMTMALWSSNLSSPPSSPSSNNFWYCYGNASMMIATKKIKKRRRWASPLFLLNTKNTQCLVGVWSYNDDGGGGNNSYHWCCGCYEFPHPCQVKWERKRAQQEKKKKKDKGKGAMWQRQKPLLCYFSFLHTIDSEIPSHHLGQLPKEFYMKIKLKNHIILGWTSLGQETPLAITKTKQYNNLPHV